MISPKPVIGLAGGISSGKSLVASLLAELGAGIIDSDSLNHEILARPDVREQLKSWWGSGIFDANGACDRRKLAKIVFDSETERRRLEGLTHPLIEQLRAGMMQRFESDPGITVIVLDSPLLFESGLDKLCDAVVFVEVDEDVRLERARDRRGWDPDEIRRREQFQLPLDIKRSRADYLVQNNSDIHALRRQVERVYQQIAFSARPGA